MPKKFTVSDGKLVLFLEPAEGGWYAVTSPLDPALITQAKTLEDAFVMANDARKCLKAARAKLARELGGEYAPQRKDGERLLADPILFEVENRTSENSDQGQAQRFGPTMKRKTLEKHLRTHGCEYYQHGARHDIWINPSTGVQSPIPRHTEINTFTARDICRQLGVPEPSGR